MATRASQIKMVKIGNISFEKSVGGVVFRKEGDRVLFLLLHYISGHWDFPKGHVETGEKEQETLRREILEETGIGNIEVYKGFRKSMYYSYKPKGKEKEIKKGVSTILKRVVYYVCETKEKEIIISNEHRGFRWLEFDEATKRISHDNGRMILAGAHEFLKKKL